MTVRPIDGNELKNRIRHMPRTVNPDLVQYSLVQAIIANMPTLTPPNEALTCEGCDMQGEKVTPCASCIRDPRVCDYYTRRLPEKEEDT